MKIYKIKDVDTKVIVREGHIEDSNTELIINWAFPGLRTGPNSFYRIHRKAGPALFNSTIAFEDSTKDCDCISTIAPNLDCKLILHTIIPVHKANFLMCFRNIAETVKAYMEDNLCRTLTIYIPEQPALCMAGIKEFLLDIGLKEVHVLYLNNNEFIELDSFFNKFAEKETLGQKFDKTIRNWLIKFGNNKQLDKFFKKIYGGKREAGVTTGEHREH